MTTNTQNKKLKIPFIILAIFVFLYALDPINQDTIYGRIILSFLFLIPSFLAAFRSVMPFTNIVTINSISYFILAFVGLHLPSILTPIFVIFLIIYIGLIVWTIISEKEHVITNLNHDEKNDLYTNLAKLAELKEKELITEEEFNSQKSKILDN